MTDVLGLASMRVTKAPNPDEFAILRAVYDHGGVPVARPFFADDAKNLILKAREHWFAGQE